MTLLAVLHGGAFTEAGHNYVTPATIGSIEFQLSGATVKGVDPDISALGELCGAVLGGCCGVR